MAEIFRPDLYSGFASTPWRPRGQPKLTVALVEDEDRLERAHPSIGCAGRTPVVEAVHSITFDIRTTNAIPESCRCYCWRVALAVRLRMGPRGATPRGGEDILYRLAIFAAAAAAVSAAALDARCGTTGMVTDDG